MIRRFGLILQFMSSEDEEDKRAHSVPCDDTVKRQMSESQEERLHPGTKLAGTLILDFLASRTVRKKIPVV